jgi:hypothetical protein
LVAGQRARLIQYGPKAAAEPGLASAEVPQLVDHTRSSFVSPDLEKALTVWALEYPARSQASVITATSEAPATALVLVDQLQVGSSDPTIMFETLLNPFIVRRAQLGPKTKKIRTFL